IIEIDPLGATGEKVRNTAQKLRICFTIDKETIIAAGGIENIQVFKVKDSSNSVAILTATRTLNDDGSGEICVLSDQFSVFGTLLDVAKQLQSTTARNLRFSKPKQVKIGGGKKRGKKSKGKKVNRWRIKFDYEADDAVTATTQFVFKYAFIKNRKQCANVTNDQLTESVAIDGNIPFDITATNPKQQALCGTIEVVGGRTSDPSFKGRTKR
ncbi:MAG: hypothetical protein KDD70_17345, partial [Bdellovibrionales bacterium]|nr:hypothetical protein [Bdellovibrionales bacterium]